MKRIVWTEPAAADVRRLDKIRPWSIVISRLEEIDAACAHLINQPVLLSDSPGPTARQHVFERLGLANAAERIAKNSFDEFQNT